jgi:hypothetical protein
MDPRLMVDYWADSNSKALRLAERYPENILIVKYEELIKNSEESIKTILNFCSLDFHEFCFDYDKLKDREGNKWRANSSFYNNRDGYDVTRIGRGKSKLDSATLESIRYKAGVVIDQLRY